MPESRRPLFRATALERYVRRRDRVVLPRTVQPGAVRPLWLALALLLGASGVGAIAPVPDLVPGIVVVTGAGPAETERAAHDAIRIAVAPTDRPRIHAGQAVTIRAQRGESFRATIEQTDGEQAVASLLPTPQRPPDGLLAGVSLTAEIEVGTRPVWTLFIPGAWGHDV